jgi:uncharacterized damage-inducible protein DinB
MATEKAGERQRILRRLGAEMDRVVAFFESLPAEAWDKVVYDTGSEWRVHQVLAHFLSSERAYLRYIRDVLAGGPGVPRDLDIDAFNEAESPPLSLRPVDSLLAEYRQTRQELMQLTESLAESDLDRRGYHPWFGEMSLAFFLKLCYNHQSMHLREVRKAIELGRPLRPNEGQSGRPATASSSG